MARSTEFTILKRSKTGFGLFAASKIPKDTKIIQYIGELISNDDEDLIEGKYLFDLNDKYTIDGRSRDNLARYINHSCVPNSGAFVIKNKIWIIAKKNIKKGEEITFDYGEAYFDQHIKPKGCKCEKCSPTD